MISLQKKSLHRPIFMEETVLLRNCFANQAPGPDAFLEI